MQQSDELLITSLQDYISIPAHVKLLNNIKSEQLFVISLSILQSVGSDVTQIKSIENQKFKSTTRLNQKLYKDLQIQLELNDLLNPTVNFVRKTLLTFLTKLGANQNNQISNPNIEDESAEKRKRKRNIKNWFDDEWIHPNLLEANIIYEAYKYPLTINRKTLKSNILPNLFRSSIKNNTLQIISTSLNKNIFNQKQNEQNAGFLRKKAQQTAHHINTAHLISSNFQDWNMAQQKLNKIKRKIQKDKQAIKQKQIEIIKANEKNEQSISIFQTQVENKIQEKQKQKQILKDTVMSTQTSTSIKTDIIMSDSNDNPLQKIKKEAENKKKLYENLIQQLLLQLNQKKQEVFSIQTSKEQLERNIQVTQQKIITLKAKTQEFKKQVEKKQLVLSSIESAKPIQDEIKKYQDDIKGIEEELKNQVVKTHENIEKIKNQSDKKIQDLKDLKMKLHRIQTQYREVCEQIQEKSSLRGKIKINKSGISRVYYSKKIGQIDKRWRQTHKQSIKIKKDLQLFQQKTKKVTDSSTLMQKDIINTLDADRNKADLQAKALRQIFVKCQTCFKNTMDTLQRINQIKEETRQYEVKVHSLTSQNYKAGIQKVNLALVELKKQIQQISWKNRN